MKEDELKKILRIILSHISNTKVIWRLDGSCNLLVQGIVCTPNDCDIIVSKKSFLIFTEKLTKFLQKKYYDEKINTDSAIFSIEGIVVEVNHYKDKKLNMFDKIKPLSWQGLNIPILPLKNAKKFYTLINRPEKVKLINKYLLKNR